MSGKCLTCLSSKNLIVMGELEWKVFYFLLHPIIRKYPDVRNSITARLCTDCQRSMKFVGDFRKCAIFNFEQLMNLWDLNESTIVTEDPLQPPNTIKTELLSPCVPDATSLDKKQLTKGNESTIVTEDPLQPPNTMKTELLSPCDPDATSLDKKQLTKGISTNLRVFTVRSHELKKVKSEIQSDNEDINTDEADMVELKTEAENDNLEESNSNSNKESVVLRKHVLRRPDAVKKVVLNPTMQLSSDNKVPSDPLANDCRSRPSNMPPNSTKEKRKHLCNSCDKTYQTVAALWLHEQVQHGNLPTMTCKVCNKTIKNRFAMKKHMKSHNVKNKDVYCDTCDHWYTKQYYKYHLKASLKHNKKEDIGSGSFQCSVCNRSYVNKGTLDRHILENHEDSKYCSPCDKWFTPASYRAHVKFSSKHVSEDLLRFICDHCGKKFGIKNTLKLHIKSAHLKLKPFKCPHCPRVYALKSPMNYHVRSVHGNKPLPKNHVCEVCGSAFRTSSLLRNHMPVHTGERPYKCGKCDATFGHKAALYLHNRYKHERKKCPPKKKKKAATTMPNKEESGPVTGQS